MREGQVGREGAKDDRGGREEWVRDERGGGKGEEGVRSEAGLGEGGRNM